MRYLLRISFLIIIMTLTTATASADKYSRAWKKVDKFMKEDLPESAAKEINNIWDMAAKDRNSREMLKSAAYLIQVQQSYDENSIESGIELLSTLLPKLKVKEHKAICHAFLAKGYICYWETVRNRRSADALPTDETDPPLSHWTAKMICDTICYHLDQSINLAGDVSSGYYQEFFPGGNKAGQKLRPMLVDMLMDNAMYLITDLRLPLGKKSFLDNPLLYGSMQDYLAATTDLKADDPDMWQFYVLRRLIQHNYGAKPDICCTIDIRRMTVLNSYLERDIEWNRNDEEWLKGAVALAQSYTKKVRFSTMFYSMAARKITDNNIPDDKAQSLLRQAHDMCIAAQRKWPKSEGAYECMSIKDELERKCVEIEFTSDFLPGERNIAKLKYTNIRTAYFKVVEVPGRLSAQDDITMLSQLNQCNVVAEWSMSLNDPGDYMEHSALFGIMPVMQGSYYLMASTGPYFSSGDCISYRYVECNGIRFLKVVQDNGTLCGIAVNTRTGKPVPDCKYSVWRLNNMDEQVRMVTSGITGADGSIRIEGMKNDRYKIELEASGNRGNETFDVPWISDMPSRQFAKIYTDRFTYLPGDTVRYIGVVYGRDGENGHLLAGRGVNVSIRLGNDEYTDSLVTDSMGVFKGTVCIPRNCRPDRYTVMAECDDESDDDFWAYTSINIESFRQPKFEVKIDSQKEEVLYDRPVTITGKVMSYTGVPLNGATVSWYAGLDTYSCHRFCIPDDKGNIRIGAGERHTDADGSFSFDVTVPSDQMILESGNVRIIVSVTDVNGETHESGMFFSASQKPERSISILSEGNMLDRNGEVTFRLTASNNNGYSSARINVKVSRLSWLETPGLPLPIPGDRLSISDSEIKELSASAYNQNLKERFPLYDFDFKGEDVIESAVFEGIVPFDKDDFNTSGLILDGLQSGVYRVVANAYGFGESSRDFILCREDDYDFVPQNRLLWARRTAGRTVEVGDTVRILMGSNHKGAVIHYMVENRYGICDQGMLECNGHAQMLSIPVTDEMTGMFAVSYSVLYEGVAENGCLDYTVPDRKHELKVELETFRSELEPDTEEEWKIRITDWYGNPVRAALMLDMYDRALDVFGLNRMLFEPFSSNYIRSRNLFSSKWLYSDLNHYAPWNHTFGSDHVYKGKRAITGTLLDPFMEPFSGVAPDRKRRGLPILLEEMSVFCKSDVDNALQGRVAGLDVVFSSGDLGSRSDNVISESQIRYVDTDPESEEIKVRSNLNPTGLFGYVMTDADGMAAYRFRVPQLLTEWKIQGIAFTDSLASGRIDTTMVTRKKIMVEPAAPRFLRQGDRMEFTVKVSNMTDQAVKADVVLAFTDAVTGQTLGIIEGATKKNVTVPAGGNTSTSFTVKVPAGLTAVTYRLTARTQGHSDGVEETIPVLSNRTQVVEALSLFNNGNEKRTFRFEVLDKPRSGTMADEQLTLEYSASPIWYAIQALPSMIKVDDPSNLRLMHSLLGAAISQDLCDRYPVIREMLDEWAALPASEWQTQLERNEKLTGTLLEETPWLYSSNSERDRLRSLATALGQDEALEAVENALKKLADNQMADGGWPWIEGSMSSPHITDEILQGLGLLIENRVIDVTPDMRDMLQRGLDYLDGYFYRLYNTEHKPESLGYSELSYLMTRSYYRGYTFSATTRASYTYFMRLAEIQDTHDLNLYFRAQLALLMARQGNSERAQHIAATLLERSLYSDEMGRYWRDNAGGLLWHEAPVETQALIIRTLLSTGNRNEAVEAARWLLKQRQTTGWCSSAATAAAVTALLATGADVQLESDPDITVYVGKDAVKASGSKATAGYTTMTWNAPISSDKADIRVESNTPGISWGAVYRSFTENLDKVEHTENGMQLKRTIWRVIRGSEGDRLEEVKSGTKLHVGDLLKVQFELTTDRNLEYLQLSDMRAAAVEPVSTRAGYRYNWQDDIGYYSAPGNTRNVFYIDRLSKGSYVIEYEVNVQKPGRFIVGNAVMQCLYAPAFRATTTSAVITVE